MKKLKRKIACVSKDCVACGSCINICPLSVMHISDGVRAKSNPDKCTGCGKCAIVCPAQAIEVRGGKVQAHEAK